MEVPPEVRPHLHTGIVIILDDARRHLADCIDRIRGMGFDRVVYEAPMRLPWSASELVNLCSRQRIEAIGELTRASNALRELANRYRPVGL